MDIIQQLNLIKDNKVSETEAKRILESCYSLQDSETLDLRIHILHEQLITSPSPIIRAAAVSGLRIIHNEETLRHLRQAWVREEDQRLKIFIRKVLDELLRG